MDCLCEEHFAEVIDDMEAEWDANEETNALQACDAYKNVCRLKKGGE